VWEPILTEGLLMSEKTTDGTVALATEITTKQKAAKSIGDFKKLMAKFFSISKMMILM